LAPRVIAPITTTTAMNCYPWWRRLLFAYYGQNGFLRFGKIQFLFNSLDESHQQSPRLVR
jgi:hypothetical protein